MYPYNQFNQYSQMQYQVQSPAQDERIWVQGQGGADAYLVAPNGFVRLWDATRPVFYEKRADHTGRPSMESFEYKRCDVFSPIGANSGTYGTNALDDELSALKSRITALERRMINDEQNGTNEPIPEFPENLSGRSEK